MLAEQTACSNKIGSRVQRLRERIIDAPQEVPVRRGELCLDTKPGLPAGTPSVPLVSARV